MNAVYTSVTICLFGVLTTLEFVYNNGSTTKTIWGFYNTKQRTYYAPVNSTKCGDQVDISDTTPYTAMQILKPLAPTVLNFL